MERKYKVTWYRCDKRGDRLKEASFDNIDDAAERYMHIKYKKMPFNPQRYHDLNITIGERNVNALVERMNVLNETIWSCEYEIVKLKAKIETSKFALKETMKVLNTIK